MEPNEGRRLQTSANIIRSANPIKERLVKVLKEVKESDLTRCHQQLNEREQYDHILKEKIDQVKRYIKKLEEIHETWLKFLEEVPETEREIEERKYNEMTEDERGILSLIADGEDAISILRIRRKFSNRSVINNTKAGPVNEARSREPTNMEAGGIENPAPLPTFSGNPRQWREFWSAFETAVHNRDIPDVHKLLYLLSCLKDDARRAVKGYLVVPENYRVVQQKLAERFGDPDVIAGLLYKDLQSIESHKHGWQVTLEMIEKILGQLEAMGEDIEHMSVWTLIEIKLPKWIRSLVRQQKLSSKTWSVTKTRELLRNLVKERKLMSTNRRLHSNAITTSFGRKQKESSGGDNNRLQSRGRSSWSANRAVPNQNISNKKSRRPCVFCNNEHWDDECRIYSTVSQRLTRLRKLNACLNCLKRGHIARDCKVRKKRCFHCKGSHNSALCDLQGREAGNQKKNMASQVYEAVLLLCRRIRVANPEMPGFVKEAVTLFSAGSQLSYISKRFASQLMIEAVDGKDLKIITIGEKVPTKFYAEIAHIGVETKTKGDVLVQIHILEHLANELQMINVEESEIRSLLASRVVDDLRGEWVEPDLIIGADYYYHFITLNRVRKAESGFSLLETEVGPILAGRGRMKGNQNRQVAYVGTAIVCTGEDDGENTSKNDEERQE